ncbi:MAG: TetR/AcrR family transcriptional regulator [Actinobacteria bacterium]|nr:TetR/AcrR family transcriptional regulator [Actinomycetota bacterium]
MAARTAPGARAPASGPEPGADGVRGAWLVAGQDLLRRGGYPAVKLSSLCEITGRTTGSFYHHFSGMADYLVELASFFGTEQPRAVLDRLASLAPSERLAELERLSMQLHMGSLHRAMRDWATVDGPAAEAVRDADRVLLEFIRDALVAAGVACADAELRAEVVYALAIARIDPPWRRRSTSIDAVLDALPSTTQTSKQEEPS